MNWIKEIYFQESGDTCDETHSPSSKRSNDESHDYNSGASGVIQGYLDPTHFERTCVLCDDPEGVCIKCDFAQCRLTFHVRCAIEADIIRHIDDMHTHKHDENIIYVYCERHRALIEERERLEKLEEEKLSSARHEQWKPLNQLVKKH